MTDECLRDDPTIDLNDPDFQIAVIRGLVDLAKRCKRPTEHMIRAGVCALNENSPRSSNRPYGANCELVEAIFKAMIEEGAK